jgi:hypothetical protein
MTTSARWRRPRQSSRRLAPRKRAPVFKGVAAAFRAPYSRATEKGSSQKPGCRFEVFPEIQLPVYRILGN